MGKTERKKGIIPIVLFLIAIFTIFVIHKLNVDKGPEKIDHNVLEESIEISDEEYAVFEKLMSKYIVKLDGDLSEAKTLLKDDAELLKLNSDIERYRKTMTSNAYDMVGIKEDKSLNKLHVMMIRYSENNKREVLSNTDIQYQFADFDKDIVEGSNDDVRIILFFRDKWCPMCYRLENNLEDRINEIPDNIKILKVMTGEYEDLEKKYGIIMGHTFVEIDNKWNKKAIWSLGDNLDMLLLQMQI